MSMQFSAEVHGGNGRCGKKSVYLLVIEMDQVSTIVILETCSNSMSLSLLSHESMISQSFPQGKIQQKLLCQSIHLTG